MAIDKLLWYLSKKGYLYYISPNSDIDAPQDPSMTEKNLVFWFQTVVPAHSSIHKFKAFDSQVIETHIKVNQTNYM